MDNYIDSRFAIPIPEHAHYFELAARLLAACPDAMQGLKTPKEILDKTAELAEMLRIHVRKTSPNYISDEECSKYFKQSGSSKQP